MKNIFKATLLFGLASSMALTGCIEEVEPTNGITQDQLDSSLKAGKATLFAIPAKMVEYTSNPYNWHGWFGQPALMQVLDRQLDEMVCAKAGLSYNHFSNFEQATFDQDYWMPQFIWSVYSEQILAANKALQTYPADIESDEGKGARAVALAFRALFYLDAARWFEFLPNEKTSNITEDGNDILRMTIPVVTETMTEAEARNNPRASHDDMVALLEKDLTYAKDNIEKAEADLKDATMPGLAAVYGLFARLYMWDENYVKAAEYADLAISASGKTPLTEEQWTDPKTGFNTLNNSCIWGMQLNENTSAVQTYICNFTSFVSVETTFGYAGDGAFAYPSVGASFYKRVNNNDFRKLSWTPNASNLALVRNFKLNRFSTLADKRSFCNKFEYGPVKFRPGQGDCKTPTVACAVGLPLMRVEEMHFIKMEAVAHSNPTEGKTLLEDFMNNYRMRTGKYTCAVADADAVIEEIVFQKRVELWGEGQNFFDVKRLGYSVTRAYAGSNFYDECKFNTNGRPAWFNMPFIRTECDNNKGLLHWNNPNVNGLYTPIKD